MKKVIGFCCLALSMASTSAMAVELSALNATTLAEVERNSTPGFDKKTEAQFIQFVDLNATNLGVKELSLDAYGWGKWGVNTGTATGDLSSGYLMYRTPKSNGYVKLGRFYEYNVTGINQLDGVGVGADLGAGFRLTGFAGKPVEISDIRGRSVYGGTLSFKVPKYLDLGVSSMYEDGQPTYNADATVRHDFQNLVGFKGWASPHKIVEVSADATYNTVTNGWGEQRYNILVRTTDFLTLNGEFQDYRLKDYFANTTLPGLFAPEDTKFKKYGGGLTLRVKSTDISGFFQRYNNEADGNSSRYGGQVRTTFGHNVFSVKYMRVDNNDNVDSENRSYHQVYSYITSELTKKLHGDLSVLANFYDHRVILINKDLGLRVGGSVAYKLTDRLKLSGELTYRDDSIKKDDLSGTLWLRYTI